MPRHVRALATDVKNNARKGPRPLNDRVKLGQRLNTAQKQKEPKLPLYSSNASMVTHALPLHAHIAVSIARAVRAVFVLPAP